MKYLIAVILPVLAISCATAAPAERVPKISPREAHERVEYRGALLVCPYPQQKCPGMHLDGAITLEELEALIPALRPDQEIIFYCGCPREAAAVARATEMESRGFRHVGVVAGGFLAWILEGYGVTSTREEGTP